MIPRRVDGYTDTTTVHAILGGREGFHVTQCMRRRLLRRRDGGVKPTVAQTNVVQQNNHPINPVHTCFAYVCTACMGAV